ncbi:hypothetical protein AKO1_015118, partial [Acrasis kona]
MFELLNLTANHSMNRVGWAFLKCISASGSSHIQSTSRLQLYQYPNTLLKVLTNKQQQQPTHNNDLAQVGSELNHVYQRRLGTKPLPCTIHISIKPHEPPPTRNITFPDRPTQFNQNEVGRHTLQQMLDSALVPMTAQDSQQDLELKKQEMNKIKQLEKRRRRVSRVNHEKCLIPNKLLCRLDLARGCLCVKFSHCGRFLACACKNVIKVFDVWSQQDDAIHVFEGHIDLIYDLCWGADDQFIASASSDGTARINYTK